MLIFLVFLLMMMLVFSYPLSTLLEMGGMDEIFAAEKINSTGKVEVNLNLRLDDVENKNITIKEVNDSHYQVLIIDLESSG